MTSKTPKAATPEQLAALQRFAAKHGRTWKETLRDCWIGSNYRFMVDEDDDSAYLQQVRNTLGPSWLINFTLPVTREQLLEREARIRDRGRRS